MSAFPGKVFSRRRAPVFLCLAAAVAGTGLGWLGRVVLKSPPMNDPSAADAAGTSFSRNSLGLDGGLSPESLRAAGHDAAAAVRMAGVFSKNLAEGREVSDWLRLLAAAEEAPPSVLSRLLDVLENANEPAATRLLATRWAQLDPAGLCAMLKTRQNRTGYLPPGSAARQREELEKILATEWLRQNPEALIQALDGIPQASHLRTAKTELLHLLVAKDTERAVKLMLGWQRPLDSVDGEPLVSWVQGHPRQAAEALLFTRRKPDYSGDMDRDRCLILTETAKAWAATDPLGALKMKSDTPNLLLQDFRNLVVIAWARRDLPSAIEYVSGPEVNQSQKNAWGQSYPWGESLLQVWAATDPAAALAWADTRLTGSAKKSAASALLKTLTTQDPQRALDFLEQLPPGSARDNGVKTFAATAMQGKDKTQVLEIFQNLTALSDPGQRGLALEAAAGTLMKTAPEEFLAWFKTPDGAQAPYGLLQATAWNMMHQNGEVMHEDGEAAMNWAATLRPEAAPLIRQKVLGEWIEKDATAASTWIRCLPANDAARPAAVSQAAASLPSFMTHETFTAWLDTLPATDRPAILQGLEKSENLSPALKATLLAKY